MGVIVLGSQASRIPGHTAACGRDKAGVTGSVEGDAPIDPGDVSRRRSFGHGSHSQSGSSESRSACARYSSVSHAWSGRRSRSEECNHRGSSGEAGPVASRSESWCRIQREERSPSEPPVSPGRFFRPGRTGCSTWPSAQLWGFLPLCSAEWSGMGSSANRTSTSSDLYSTRTRIGHRRKTGSRFSRFHAFPRGRTASDERDTSRFDGRG